MRQRPNKNRKVGKSRGRKTRTTKRRVASNSVRRHMADVTSETELARHIRERDEALEQQAATREIIKVISRSAFDLPTVLDTLTKWAVQLCAADGGIISMQDGDLYWIRSVCGFSQEVRQYALRNPLRRDRGGVTGRVALEGKAVHIPDVLADPEYTAFAYQKLLGQRTNLGVPLLREGNVIGVFSLTRTTVKPFTDKQIELVSTFADHAVIAIESARLLNELRQLLDQHRRAEAALADSERQLRKARDELEMKVAERTAELGRSEAYLAEAQRHSHTGTWVLSRATKHYVYWSNESYRIWGFDPLQGVPSYEAMWQRVHPEDRDRVRKEVEAALRRKTDYAGEFRIVLPDGEIKHLKSTGRNRFSEDGEFIEVVRTDVDVTEHKRGEKAVRDSEYKLRQIIETVPSLIWSADPTGEPTQLNQRIFDYSGMRFEDFKHGGWEAFIHPDDFPETIKAFSHAIQTGTSYQTVHRLRRADGEFRWHHARGEPLRDEEGRIIQWYGLAVDINEAKKAEDRLRRSEAYLAEAQRLSHTGTSVLYGTAMLSPYLYWSEECYGIWGLDPLQGIPSRQAVWQRVHPNDRDRVRAGFEDALRQNKDYADEFRIVLPDGTTKYLVATAHRLLPAGGEIVEVICTYIDVTERKRAQEEHEKLRQLESDLAHMNRLGIIGEQAASLVHEITQPIGSARNNARAAMNFLDKQPPDLGEAREALGCVVDDADRAGNIVDRIREHIKKSPPKNERFDLNEAINEVVALARSAITKNGVLARAFLTEGALPVEGDRVQVQQVVLNLILNAVEAMGSVEEGPRELSISTKRRQANDVLVAVCDSGPGIDPKNFEHIFEAFYTTKSRGVGMGLSISRSIIDAHGGRLWADANESRGAVFQFTLPSAAEIS